MIFFVRFSAAAIGSHQLFFINTTARICRVKFDEIKFYYENSNLRKYRLEVNNYRW